MRKTDCAAPPRPTRALCTPPALVGKSDVGIVDEKVRRGRRWTSAGATPPPATGSLHPMGNRSRLFLCNEKHSFLGDFPCEQPGGTSSFAEGWAVRAWFQQVTVRLR